MILLVTTIPGAESCAAALASQLGETVKVAASPGKAARFLRTHECSALVVDQCTAESDSADIEALDTLAKAAVTVHVNLAISNVSRVVRQVRAALERRRREQATALQLAEDGLRSQLNGELAGILLSAQLALTVPELPSAAATKLRTICELASRISHRLKLPAE